MKRRTFVRGLTGAAALSQLLPVSGLVPRAHATLPALNRRMLVHLMLVGGPDFRHLLPPGYESSTSTYGHQFYGARATTLGVANTPAGYASAWNSQYAHVSAGARQFGILNGCEWLVDMWQQGHVAVVHNVVASESRDHAHSQLVWETADRTLSQVDRGLSGWGGRMADFADSSIVSLTRTPRTFCFNTNVANPSAPGTNRIVTLADPASVGLYAPPTNADPNALAISRALRQYYSALDPEMPAASPFRGFVDQERTLRDLGDRLRPLFGSFALPPEVGALLSGPTALANPGLAAQTRNLYYALAAANELDFNTMSMAFGSFDSHDIQQEELEPHFRDLFGRNGALDAMYRVMPQDVASEIVFMVGGEFGRQLRSNGDIGTDHGKGNSVMLIGYPVRGGFYGDPYPVEELNRLNEPSPDITGRTHLDSLLEAVIDHVQPGAASTVLTGLAGAMTEQGVNLSQLFL